MTGRVRARAPIALFAVAAAAVLATVIIGLTVRTRVDACGSSFEVPIGISVWPAVAALPVAAAGTVAGIVAGARRRSAGRVLISLGVGIVLGVLAAIVIGWVVFSGITSCGY